MWPSAERMEGPTDNTSFSTNVSAHFILMCDKILLQYKNQGMFGNNV
jgi:hypothetical protein